MTLKVGINGYGRIGRNVLRALYEAGRQKEISIVAVNDLGDAETNAYLTRHDSVHGRFRGEVRVDGDPMVVNGDRIRALAESDHNSFDALVCSLVARSSALGLTAGPPAELADRAVREGWIHIPTNPLSDLMNGG